MNLCIEPTNEPLNGGRPGCAFKKERKKCNPAEIADCSNFAIFTLFVEIGARELNYSDL